MNKESLIAALQNLIDVLHMAPEHGQHEMPGKEVSMEVAVAPKHGMVEESPEEEMGEPAGDPDDEEKKLRGLASMKGMKGC